MSRGTFNFQAWFWSWIIVQCTRAFYLLILEPQTVDVKQNAPKIYLSGLHIYQDYSLIIMNVYLWFYNQMPMIPSLESYKIITSLTSMSYEASRRKASRGWGCLLLWKTLSQILSAWLSVNSYKGNEVTSRTVIECPLELCS